MNPRPDLGSVSRPSSHACSATGTFSRRPRSIAASKCLSSACTPPLPMSPIRCSVPPDLRSDAHNSTSGASRKNSPEAIDCEMRTMSWATTRPAPRFRWPTSLLPICPSGRPTGSPEASSSVRGARSHSRCHVGVRPSSMALPSRSARKPQPSSTIRTTGVRTVRLVVILKGMQVSQIVRALPVVLCLCLQAPVASGQGRYRVTNDGEWFYQEPGGRRLARLARGAIVGGGVTRGDFMQVTLEGWIFATSGGASPRPEFDLAVTHAPDENLRSSAGGALVARLAEGFGLKKVGQDDRWVHVTRDGWVSTSALAIVPDVSATRTVDSMSADTTQGVLTPGRRPGADSTPTPSRQQPARPTTLYRAPDGPEAGSVTAETPLRVLGRTGDWARVQVEGWVKATDLQTAPPGVALGVSAAELRAEPQRYAGQVLRWTLQYIAVQKADDLRPDIPTGATYVLARGPLPERGFVYVIIPDGKLAAVQALAPLANIQVTARVRQGRSRYLGNPVVDLISLETSP